MFFNFSIATIRRLQIFHKVLCRFSSTRSSQQLELTINTLNKSGQYEDILRLFNREGRLFTDISLSQAIRACTRLKDLPRGVRLHQQLSPTSLRNRFIQTSLIHFYMQNYQVEQAERVFTAVEEKNVFTYGAMFKGYVTNGKPEKVLELFDQMEVQPDKVIWIVVFNACAKLADTRAIELGRKGLEKLSTTFRQDSELTNSAIDMLMKFGDLERAESLFRNIHKKTIVTYGAMIQGYNTNQLFDKAIDLFEQMTLQPNDFIYTMLYSACASSCNERARKTGEKALHQMPKKFREDMMTISSAIHMLMRFGNVTGAEHLFSQLPRPAIYSYGAMMNGYNCNDQPENCLRLLKEIQERKMTLDEATSIASINACSRLGMIRLCHTVLNQIPTRFHNSLPMKTSLIDMWGKAGAINEAEQIFQAIDRPNAIVCNAMINAYGRNGMGFKAIDVYEHLNEDVRDEISHICVLNACSHAGLADQARKIFDGITRKTAKIVTTMVDCLSRVSKFAEAQQLIDEYEQTNPPDLIMYMSMLSGARNHRHSGLSQKLYERMKTSFPEQRSDLISASVLVSNTYSSVGEGQQAQQIRRNRIQQWGAKRKIGLSWTEVQGQLLIFSAHDRSHPRSDEMAAEMSRLAKELKEHGHQFDSIWITRPLTEGESVESALCGHSEKLAIVFNLIQQPPPTFIQITKNLRVCGDCHRATKLIAKIRQRDIIVRDANRIHHFTKDGQCSCNDHF